MKRILVTGGTGFVGQWMQRTRPADLEYEIIHYLNRHGYECLPMILWDDWDAIVHLAPVPPLEPIEYCKAHPNTRLLYASSGAVYDRKTQYAYEKRAGERACLDAGIDVVIARLFTFSGAFLDDDKAISRFSKSALCGEPIVIWGDGSTVRSYMHGSEMGKWLWAILRRGERGEAYDVGSDEPVTMMELAQQINAEYGGKSQIICDGRKDDCPYYMPLDTAKTRRLLNESG